MGADEKYTKVRQQLLKQLGISDENFKYSEVTIKTGIPASTLIKKMLNHGAKILKDTTKAEAREDLLDIIFESGGILGLLKKSVIGKSQKFKEVCGELNDINNGIEFLKKFVNDPYDEETQGNRKKLKEAIDEYFKSVNQCEDTEQQDDANLVFLLLKELMAKDIERLDNKTVYQWICHPTTFSLENTMKRATRFNVIIRRSDDPKEEVAKQLSSLTSQKTPKYYYVESEPKGDPDPKDLKVFKKTVTEIGNLYLKLLEEGTKEEKLEFTRYFVSINYIQRAEDENEIVRVVNYFTSEDDKVLFEISDALFNAEPLPKFEYNINTKEGRKALFEYYIENIVKPCAGKVEKQLQDIYQQFVKEIEAEADNYKLSLNTKPSQSILRRSDKFLEAQNLKTPLGTFILDLYKKCSATATTTIDTSRLSRLANNIGYMFYSSDLEYWNHDIIPYTGPNYRDFVQITCRNKIIEKCESLMKIYQDANKSLGEFLKPYIDNDDSGIVLKLYQRSTYCIQKIYSSQFESDKQKTIIIEKSCNAVLNYIEGLLK